MFKEKKSNIENHCSLSNMGRRQMSQTMADTINPKRIKKADVDDRT